MARKIKVLEFISLDGVMQAPGGPDEDSSGNFKFGGWTAPFFDDFSGKEMAKQMAGKYDLLLGRKTYDIFASYWPTHDNQWPQVNKITKYVVSQNLKNVPWKNSVIIKDINGVKKLKKENGGDLQVYGSSDLLQSLLEEDLVDELWLKIFPLTLGKGKKIFGSGTVPAAFKLIGSKISPSGIIFANYERSGKVKTGSMV